MNKEARSKALRAASNVAFSVAFVGCGGTVAPDAAGSATAPSPSAASPSAPAPAQPSAPATAHGFGTAAPGDAPTPVGAARTTPADCAPLLDTTFPSPDGYPGTKENVSADVAACCDAALATFEADLEKGVVDDGAHRWACCANQTDPNSHGVACTPWGPPVPPPMRGRGRAPLDVV